MTSQFGRQSIIRFACCWTSERSRIFRRHATIDHVSYFAGQVLLEWWHVAPSIRPHVHMGWPGDNPGHAFQPYFPVGNIILQRGFTLLSSGSSSREGFHSSSRDECLQDEPNRIVRHARMFSSRPPGSTVATLWRQPPVYCVAFGEWACEDDWVCTLWSGRERRWNREGAWWRAKCPRIGRRTPVRHNSWKRPGIWGALFHTISIYPLCDLTYSCINIACQTDSPSLGKMSQVTVIRLSRDLLGSFGEFQDMKSMPWPKGCRS